MLSETQRKVAGIAAGISTALGATGVGGWFLGSSNPETPAGFVGYVTQSPIIGKTEFKELQTGPSSPGRSWRYNVTNISITPYSYEEDFPLDRAPLSKDGLPIQFHLTTIWRVNPEKVKQFVEHFTTLRGGEKVGEVEEAAYNDYMKQPVRSMALDEIHRHAYMDIATDLSTVNQTLLAKAQKYAADTPFEILGVVVGNIQFPPEVSRAVAARMAKAQELERMATELEITKKKAEQRVAEAEGIAKSQNIIAGTLTPQYLAHEAIEAQKLLRESPNHSVVYIPTNSLGVPVLTTDATSPAAPSTPATPKSEAPR